MYTHNCTEDVNNWIFRCLNPHLKGILWNFNIHDFFSGRQLEKLGVRPSSSPPVSRFEGLWHSSKPYGLLIVYQTQLSIFGSGCAWYDSPVLFTWIGLSFKELPQNVQRCAWLTMKRPRGLQSADWWACWKWTPTDLKLMAYFHERPSVLKSWETSFDIKSFFPYTFSFLTFAYLLLHYFHFISCVFSNLFFDS